MQEILNSLPVPMQINESVFYIVALFLVLILVLNNLIFKPLVAVLDERRSKIEEGSEAQANALKTVEESLAAYNKALLGARKSAQAQKQEMLKDSEVARQDMVGSAREEARASVASASEKIKEQVAAARTSLKAETAAIAERVTATILSR